VRTVFLGTSDFAAALLTRLAGKGVGGPDTPQMPSPTVARHSPVLVITRPDRPAGRGRKLTAPPVADAARSLGLRLAQPESINDAGIIVGYYLDANSVNHGFLRLP